MGLRAGLTYNFGRKSAEMAPRTVCPAFPRHFSYDLTFFGSWRRKGIEGGGKQYAAPDAYTVLGFNFASMYNFGYKFRAGVSLDGVYDGSANVAIADQIVEMGSSADLTVEKPGEMCIRDRSTTTGRRSRGTRSSRATISRSGSRPSGLSVRSISDRFRPGGGLLPERFEAAQKKPAEHPAGFSNT